MIKTSTFPILFAAFFAAHFSTAQCPLIPAAGIAQLNAPDLECYVWPNGTLFQSPTAEAGFRPFVGSGNAANTIFAAQLWMGGVDPGGNLRTTHQTYPQTAFEGWAAGPLDPDSGQPLDCGQWSTVFKTTRADIIAHLTDLLDDAVVQSPIPSIYGWPGKGNPFFESVRGFALPATAQSLAPFFDYDLDGQYDPSQGDWPAVLLRGTEPFVPFEMTWNVLNSQSATAVNPSFPVEAQVTAWTMDCGPDFLKNTVFTSHKMIYRGFESLDLVHYGLWVDLDLGCFEDDFFGCLPSKSVFFAYNADAVDGSVGNVCQQNLPTFSAAPPVQSVVFLRTPDPDFFQNRLDRFIGWRQNDAQEPSNEPLRVFNALRGRWSDGSAIVPNTPAGYDPTSSAATNWLFDGEIDDPTDWSMATTSQGMGDRRALGSAFYGQMWPGAVVELNAAWTAHGGGATTFENYEKMKTATDELLAMSENYLLGGCSPSPLNSLAAKSLDFSAKIRLAPNPVSNVLTVDFGGFQAEKAEILDGKGQLIAVRSVAGEAVLSLPVGQLAAGVYALKLIGPSGAAIKKFVRAD